MVPSESDDLCALSGLQHLMFCERQAALIHVERVWKEDAATAEGRILHERVDLPGGENRRGVRVERAVLLRSTRLGLVGRADVVEFHAVTAPPGLRSKAGPQWQPFPVEYKRGRMKSMVADQVQLCAQGLCLEEMYGVPVPRGALFYGQSHRRTNVELDAELRRTTEAAARRLHQLVREGVVPRAEPAAKCKSCSLEPLCIPEATAGGGRERAYLARLARAEEME